MPEIKVDAIVNLAGSGKPNLSVAPTVGSNAAISTLNTHSYTSSGTEPSSPKNGALWWDSGNDKVKVYIAGEFKEISLNATLPATDNAWQGSRALVAGASSTANDTVIQYFDITSAGNAADFGDLSADARYGSAAGKGSRVIFSKISRSSSNTMEYVTPSSLGNTTDFGDLNVSMDYTGSVSDGTRKVTGSKESSGAMGYVTIDTTGNATSFGSLSTSNWWGHNGMACGNDGTKGTFAGSLNGSSASNEIQYITIQSAGNAADFGGLSQTRDFYSFQSCSDATRTVMGGGRGQGSERNNIDYITTGTTGNATDFGDLTNTVRGLTGTSNATIAVWCGGYDGSANVNVMQSVTIQTLGNAADFGDLLTAENEQFAGSGSPS